MCVCVCLFLLLQAVPLSNRAASCADHPPPTSVRRTNVSSLLRFVRPLCLYCLIGRMSSLWLSLTLQDCCSLKEVPTEAVVGPMRCIRQGIKYWTWCTGYKWDTNNLGWKCAIRKVSQPHSRLLILHAYLVFCYTTANCFPRYAGWKYSKFIKAVVFFI